MIKSFTNFDMIRYGLRIKFDCESIGFWMKCDCEWNMLFGQLRYCWLINVIIKFISALVLFVRYEIFNKCPLLCYALIVGWANCCMVRWLAVSVCCLNSNISFLELPAILWNCDIVLFHQVYMLLCILCVVWILGIFALLAG